MTKEQNATNQSNPAYQLWAAEENWLREYLLEVAEYKVNISGDETSFKAFFDMLDSSGPPSILSRAGDSASINIFGGLRKKRMSYIDHILGRQFTSYQDINDAASIIAEDKGIKNVNLIFDTPGGEMHGVDETWDKLMVLREGRRVTAVNTGLLASAGYYLASAAHEIVSTSESNMSGSIGVLIAGLDISSALEQRGIKRVVITSKNAPNKFNDIGTEKGRQELLEQANIFEDFFFKRISAGRKLDIDYIKENFGRGGLLVSKSPTGGTDALSVKMIDKVLSIFQETGANTPPPTVSINAQQDTTMSDTVKNNADTPAAERAAATAQALQERYDSGFKAGRESVETRVSQAMTYMTDGSPYLQVKSIQNICLKVIKGETAIEALTAAVAGYDAALEAVNSGKSKTETAKIPETPPDKSGGPTTVDGKIETPEQLGGLLAEVKKMKGMPVK